jgi:hypothetical protein
VRRRFLLCVFAAVASVSSPVLAHDQEDGYSWTNDPANATILDDCTDMPPHVGSSYMFDHRITPELSSEATRLEVTSEDAVVTEFVVSATNWVFHAEQPDSSAHAERVTAGVPPSGLLLRMGFERKDAKLGLPVNAQVRVFTDAVSVPEVLDFAIPFFAPQSGDMSSYGSGRVCREDVPTATDSRGSAPSPASPAGSATADGSPSDPGNGLSSDAVSGGFPVGKTLIGAFTIFMAAALLWVLRLRR